MANNTTESAFVILRILKVNKMGLTISQISKVIRRTYEKKSVHLYLGAGTTPEKFMNYLESIGDVQRTAKGKEKPWHGNVHFKITDLGISELKDITPAICNNPKNFKALLTAN